MSRKAALEASRKTGAGESSLLSFPEYICEYADQRAKAIDNSTISLMTCGAARPLRKPDRIPMFDVITK